MVTIGDSFSIVATLAGLALTLWSFLIVCALLFPARVEESRRAISVSLGRSFGSGLVALFLGVAGMVVLQAPNPLAKLFGTLILAAYFGCVAIGAAGISKLAAERLRTLTNQNESMFQSFTKSSAYIVIAGMLPILGWFLFAPMFMIFAGGAGLKAALKSQPIVEVA